MSKTAAGGAATVNGVIYQMLWALLRAARLNALRFDRPADDAPLEGAVLVLEPRGGGGDVQEVAGGRRVVEQLKAKSGGGTWSLREVVEDVLPDLFLARDARLPETEYRFVTEGRMGEWAEVYDFFQGLKARGDPAAAIAALDDTRVLKFKRGNTRPGAADGDAEGKPGEKKPFWPLDSYTEKSVFARIVEAVKGRKAVDDRRLPAEEVERGVWDVLANFTFVGGQTMELVEREIDALLLALIARTSGLAEKRLALLGGLAVRAAQGGAVIESAGFLAEYGLDSVPLDAWVPLRRRAAAVLGGVLRRAGYDPALDVRAAGAADLSGRWPAATPLLAIGGESGGGKSWALFALALHLAAGDGLPILIESAGDADADCRHAADIFWRAIKDGDEDLPLDRVAVRLRRLLPLMAGGWLTLFIDAVRTHEEARRLARLPWEEWGVRVACTCLPDVARTMKAVAGGRCVLHEVSDFTIPELNEYLGRRLGGWGGIPTDVRQTLRRPLLARLYADLAQPGGWAPANEYDLYARCWGRLGQDEMGDHRLDVVPLHRLALDVLEGRGYPWPLARLTVAGLGNEALARLRRVGWLQEAQPHGFQVWHDRLLNWAVAEALVARLDAREATAEEVCGTLRRLLHGPPGPELRPLGYVPMDALWLLTDPRRDAAIAEQAIEALEGPP